jgi:hypothetical protein
LKIPCPIINPLQNKEGEERGKGRNLMMAMKMIMMILVGDDFIGDLYADDDEK